MYFNKFALIPELRPLRYPPQPQLFSGVDSLHNIRHACHYVARLLGLARLSDPESSGDSTNFYIPGDINDHPVMDWCLMGSYGGGILSIGSVIPSHLCGWSKQEIGWLTPPVLADGFEGEIVLKEIETYTDSSLYMLPIDAVRGEYFLLEYRNPEHTGLFDKWDSDFCIYFWPQMTFGGDPLDRGLLITHVDRSVINPENFPYINIGTPDFPNYAVAIEDAGYNPNMDYTHNPGGVVSDSAQWWYPYESQLGALFSSDVPGQNLFDPTTYPSSDGYGGPSGITVRVDSIVGDLLYAWVFNPARYDPDNDGIGDPSDNCPDIYNPLQENADGDDAGDPCDACPNDPDNDTDEDTFCGDLDNCPEISNPGQEDQDEDSVGDLCDNCLNFFNPDQADDDSDGIGNECDFICGDANGDETINVGDAVALINYVFKGGPAPDPVCAGDANGDGNTNVGDAVYLIAFIFSGGGLPVDDCCP
jgi:hypothetical protein